MPKPSFYQSVCRQGAGAAVTVVLAGLLIAPFALAGPSTLPAAYRAPLQAAGIPAEAASVVIEPLGGDGIRIARNEGVLRNPASTMKLVTTYAALELLGPDFRWHTEVWSAAPLENGRLDGDLILRGGGDPALVIERFWLLVHRLRAYGIREIDGDVILDRRAFEPGPADPQDFDGALLRPYNVAPDALLVNFKSVAFHFVPEPGSEVVRVLVTPPLAGLAAPATVAALDGPCGDWRARLEADFSRPLAPEFIGGYAPACGERSWYVSLLDHPAYLQAVFRGLWEDAGGRWAGTLREATGAERETLPAHGTGPDRTGEAGSGERKTEGAAELRRLVRLESPPLAQVIRDINKYSNNVMARQLFLTLGGRAEEGTPGNEARARRALERWLARRNLDPADLRIDNGAGLSREARITPALLARLLRDAFEGPLMPELLASLPLSGVDGTMRRRGAAAGAAHVKTGRLRDVRAMAGYVHAAGGRRYLIVAIVNHPRAAVAERAHDALLEWLYESG